MVKIPARPYPISYRLVGTTISLMAFRPGYSTAPEFVSVQVEHHHDNTIDLVPFEGYPGNDVPGIVRMTVAEYKAYGIQRMDDRAKAVWALGMCGWKVQPSERGN